MTMETTATRTVPNLSVRRRIGEMIESLSSVMLRISSGICAESVSLVLVGYHEYMISLSGEEVGRVLAVAKRSKEAIVFRFGEKSEARIMNDIDSIRVHLLPRDNVDEADQIIRVHPSVFSGIASVKDGVSISDTEVSSGRKKIHLSKLEPSYNENLFKLLDKDSMSASFTLSAEELGVLQAGAQFANRAADLGGVTCFMYHEGLVFVALDGYKIFLHRINDIPCEERKVMVQSESIESIASLCRGDDITIMFGYETNMIAAHNSMYEYLAPLSAKQPNRYESFGLSYGDNDHTSVDMSEISDFVKSASIIGDGSMAVHLDVDPEAESVSMSAQGRNGETMGMDFQLDSEIEGSGNGENMSALGSASMLQAATTLFKGVAQMWMDRRTLSFSDGESTIHLAKRRM